jgi:plastocyanin
MKFSVLVPALVAAAALSGCKTSRPEMMGNMGLELDMASFYLPNAEASRIVSVTTNGVAAANVLVQTHRVAVKETGPEETVAAFGEVYAFSPNFFAVRRGEQTKIRFWNLQPDDNHGFMLLSPNSQVLMNVWLPPLKETAYFFTFHDEGLYNFVCTLHPTVMMGQILVLPPKPPEQ